MASATPKLPLHSTIAEMKAFLCLAGNAGTEAYGQRRKRRRESPQKHKTICQERL